MPEELADDLVASVAGAVVGGATSVIEQAASGKGINWARVGISAGAGAAGAEASLYCGPLCGGAIAGGLNEAGNEIYSGHVNPVHIAAATATGGLFGWGIGSFGWNGGSIDQAPLGLKARLIPRWLSWRFSHGCALQLS